MLKIVTNTLMLLMIGIISGFLFLIFIIYILEKIYPILINFLTTSLDWFPKYTHLMETFRRLFK